MLRKEILEPAFHQYVDPFRIVKGKGFRLKNFDPGDTCGLTLDKRDAAELLERGTKWLAEVQDMLYAQDRWSMLLIFQAMDAAGKDSTIKHVMSGVNPQGCQVNSFKRPSSEELDHDYLWRSCQGSRTRAHRHLQPVILRGSACGARAPRVACPDRSSPEWSPNGSGRNA